MSSRDVIEYGAMGVGATVILWVCLAFAPSLITSLSIVDILFDWEYHEFFNNVSDPEFSKACFWFFIVFIILGFIQLALVFNIRHTWGIVVPWFLLSIHPFICWLLWMGGPSIQFPGVNWMPW